MTEPERGLTPEMCEYAGQSAEHAAWIAEWRRVGAPPGSLRYVMAMMAVDLNALAADIAAEQALPRDFTLPTVEAEDD